MNGPGRHFVFGPLHCEQAGRHFVFGPLHCERAGPSRCVWSVKLRTLQAGLSICGCSITL